MMWKNNTTELRMEDITLPATELGTESSLPDLLGETIIQNNLIFCLGEEDEIFEAYGKCETSYPYRQRNAYSKDLQTKQLKTIVLENRYLKATFLPEYGGRLWSLIDKQTSKNLLYTNDVLRFRNLAVRNAWFSGGVEWNIGIIGHSPFTTEPLYTAVLEDEKGTPILRMYEYERIRKVYYQMDFWLSEEDTFLNCRMRIMNENEQVVPMYWWSNIAVPEFENGRIIVPAKKAYTSVDHKVSKVDIPLVNGIDVTHYNDIPNAVDYFFEIEEQNPKYIVNVDETGYGLLHLSTNRLQSRKLFSWGHNEASSHWQEFLTQDAGNYIEIQAGLPKTQYGCIPMAPHTTWEWMEQYGAIQLSPEQQTKSNAENSTILTNQIQQSGQITELEKTLQTTKELAQKPGTLLLLGSCYGAVPKQRNHSKHLDFSMEKESFHNWNRFLQTGILHEPDPQNAPDEFWTEETIFSLLKKTIDKQNKKNWYAHYQLGIGYFINKKYKKAKKEWKLSYELKKNPWACHGLSCIYYLNGNNSKTISWMVRGLKQRTNDISYLKEGFKLLHLCGGYSEIIHCYETLGQKEINRLTFYYISAKYQSGHCEEALELLEKGDGLVMEDIREGEDALEQLWSQLQIAVTGQDKTIPYRYRFLA